MQRFFRQKAIQVLALICLLTNSFTPLFAILPQAAYAQAVTPTPSDAPAETLIPTPTDVQPTVEPTQEVTPTPSEAPTEAPTPTDAPTATINPTPTSEPTVTPTDTVNNNSPPTDESLSAVVLDNTSATSINLDSYATEGSASLTTDKTDYAPTDTVLISGSGLVPNATYTLYITSSDEPPVNFSTEVTADENGNFAYAYQLDGNLRVNYQVQLKDLQGNVVASTSFRDPLGYDKSGYDKGTASWGTGNQSGYSEGDWVQYQYSITGITGTVPNFNVVFDEQVSGRIFIDAFSNFRVIVDAPYVTGNSVLANGTPRPGSDGIGVGQWHAFTPQFINHTYDGSCDSTTDAVDTPTAEHCFRIDPAFIHGVTPDFPASFVSGTHKVTIFFEAHMAPTYVWSSGNEAKLDCSPASIYCVVAPASAVPTTVYGTDVYNSWTTSAFTGAGGGGSNKHFNIQDQSAGSNGGLTLPIPAVAVPAGSITITKVTNPTPNSTAFGFTGDFGPFTLDTDPSVTNPNSITFNNLIGGTYNVTETLVTNWALGTVTCTNGVTPSQSSNAVAITITSGQTTNCTFTNTLQQGTIELKKVWVGTGGQTTLQIGTSAGGTQVDTQLTGAAGADPLTTGQNSVNPGTYYMSESGGLANYSTAALSCFNDADNNGTNNGEASVTVGASDSVPVASKQHVICTYTNTRNTGTVIVKKVMVGGTDTFTYTGTPNGSISVNEGTIQATVDTGAYSSTEGAKTGWDLTSVVCDDGNSTGDVPTRTASFNVESGETVTCTFTNTKRGHVIIEKNAIPDSNTQAFTFNNNFGNGNPATFDLTDTTAAGLPSSDAEVLPGTYAVSEDPVTGWQSPESTSCTDGSPVSSIEVSPGETVTCTFVNEKLATIILVKNTIGGDGDFDFDMTGTGLPSSTQLTTVGNTDSETFNNLDPDNTYTIAENVPSGWDLTSATCGNGDPVNNITPNAGEVITCTFTNTQKGHLIVHKITDPSSDKTTEFNITATGSGVISGNADRTLTGGSQTDYEVTPGSYSVAETIPAGWEKTGDTCQNVAVAAGETKNCTITNTKYSTIIVEKQTLPDGDTTDFTFTGDVAGTASDGEQIVQGSVLPGTYTSVESAQDHWDLTDITCDDSDSTGDISTSTATFNVQAGETIICVFTNIKRGHIIVDKVTDPSGDTQSFAFTAGGNDYSNFSLTDTDTPNDQEVVPGAYSVSEGAVAGWDSNGGLCDKGETPASLDVDPGETVTCTFTNTKRGHLIVNKVTDPADDPTEFTIHATGDGDITEDPEQILTTSSPVDYEVTPGTYSVAEDFEAGWDETDNTCSDVAVAAGATEECTITNTKRGSITIIKDAQPNDCQDFAFNFTDKDGFSLDDDSGVVDCQGSDQPQSKTFDNLPTNADYTTTETLPNAFWEFGGASCTGNAVDEVGVTNGVTVTLSPGENVTCTFVNNKLGPTRTLGFWKTHTEFTTSIFTNQLSSHIVLGDGISHQDPIITSGELFGAWYSSISMKSTGKGKNAQRSAVDQTRMQLAWQWLAADLNCAAFGCSSAIQTLLTDASTAYAGTNISLILSYASQLDAYNNSGDTIVITPPPGSATPKISESTANSGSPSGIAFWDQP